MVHSRYLAVSFLQRTQKRPPIARPYGRAMVGLFRVHNLNTVLAFFLSYCVQYRVILDRYISILYHKCIYHCHNHCHYQCYFHRCRRHCCFQYILGNAKRHIWKWYIVRRIKFRSLGCLRLSVCLSMESVMCIRLKIYQSWLYKLY